LEEYLFFSRSVREPAKERGAEEPAEVEQGHALAGALVGGPGDALEIGIPPEVTKNGWGGVEHTGDAADDPGLGIFQHLPESREKRASLSKMGFPLPGFRTG
jgi:hypothetical protein